MPHILRFYIKKPFCPYFVSESIYFIKCDDAIFVKCQTFTFCKMSHFSKNVNHLLFEMPYLINKLLDYNKNHINKKMNETAIDVYYLFFFLVCINVINSG